MEGNQSLAVLIYSCTNQAGSQASKLTSAAAHLPRSSWQDCCRAQHWQPGSGEKNGPKKEQGGGGWKCCPIQLGPKGGDCIVKERAEVMR